MTAKELTPHVTALTDSVTSTHVDIQALTEILMLMTQRFSSIEASVATLRRNQEGLHREVLDALAVDQRAAG